MSIAPLFRFAMIGACVERWQLYWMRRGDRQRIARTGRNRVLAAARQECFYTDWDVPDDLNGRFEIAVIHAALVLRRLTRCGQAGQDLAQDVFDALFRSFDDSLRANGVGDLSVGKKIKRMAQAFYGRAAAYDQAIRADESMPALLATIERNLALPASSARALADYICQVAESLDRISDDDMLAARFDWSTK